MERSVVFLLVATLLLGPHECLRLNDFITHYEPLTYDHHQLHQDHSRIRRWADQNGSHSTSDPLSLQFQFEAHGRTFNLTLRRDENTFGEQFELHLGTDEPEPFVENSHLFEGELLDIPGSSAYGAIRNGIFDGKIVTPNETFYVESSLKFSFPGESQGHSVIYKESDIDGGAILFGPNGTAVKGGAIPCGATNDTHAWMNRIQTSQVPEVGNHDAESQQPFSEAQAEPHFSSYSLAREFSSRSRSKRQTNPTRVPHRTTCTLHIRTDPMLWRYIAKQEGMEKAAISEEILSIVGQHVKAANEIFAESAFDAGNGTHKNIQFVVRRVKIDTDEECSPDYTGIPNPFCVENIDVSNFLDLHSRTNYADFCLSYTFTYRDFTGGVVGLAWVASPDTSGAAGGICEKYSDYSDFTSKRSLNTGIVTFLNYNRRLPPKISQLTFTHELGHNFGSTHDPDGDSCQPGGKRGNFLMYSSATNGYLANNPKFSPCSIKNIGEVLDKLVGDNENSRKRNCFEATQSTFCGNQIVEKGEECDCGYDSVECTDKCCNARRSGSGERSQDNPERCKRTRHSQCSPSEGPCCESDCSFSPVVQHQSKPCQIETECTESSFCNGRSPSCPDPRPKPNNETLCNNGTQVCIDGVCRGSLCVKFGFEECYLKHEDHPDKSTLCDLACVNAEGQCVSISTLRVTSSNKLKLRPGTPCDNFRGYCDVFLKCRAVDEKGPLLRLKKIFFNKGTYRNVIEWIKGHPWWSGCIGLGFLLLLAMFVKCCAVHTPSSNPNLPQHLKFSETLQRPIRTLQRRPKPGNPSAPPPDTSMEMGPARGRRKPGPRPLPSERASMAPFH